MRSRSSSWTGKTSPLRYKCGNGQSRAVKWAAEEVGRYGAPNCLGALRKPEIAKGTLVTDGWLQFRLPDPVYRG
jgi:hypothetical protein